MDYYQRACELKEDTIANRRHIHTNAEVGLETPKARAFVKEKLREYGLEPRDCGHGVVATLGSGSPVILLRADMDALPMPEESGEPFACPDGEHAHACGHDFHAAMLLTAARMLKETEGDLKGTVKLMFQPAEETFEGAKDMIAAGVLEDPKPDVALAYHVAPGQMPVGIFMYNDKNTMMYSVDGFRIEVKGKVPFAIDVDSLVIPKEPDVLSDDVIRADIERRPMKVVAATVGEDEHSVGLREIIDIKHGGIEKYGIEVHYLGTSCPPEKLVNAAVELNADAIMASTIISHDDIHYKNIAKIDAIAREMGIRDKIIFIAGGTQVTPELARKAGADEGFGRGSRGVHNATFLVKRRWEMEKAAAEKADSENK